MLFALLRDLGKKTIGLRKDRTTEKPARPGGSENDTGPMLELEAACRRALTSMPNCGAALNQLGFALAETGRLAEAEEAFRRAVFLEPDIPSAQFNLGRLFEQTGHGTEAEVQYRRVLELAPDFADAYIRLGILLREANRLSEAEAALQSAVDLLPDNDEALDNLDLVREEIKDRSAVGAARPADGARQGEPAGDLTPHAPQTNGAVLLRPDRKQAVFVENALDPRRTVLLLVTDRKGNLPCHLLFPRTTNTRIIWTMDYAADVYSDKVPAYDLVFNAMGDPDVTGDTTGAVNAFLKVCDKPLLNHPDKVALTARNRLPGLLEGIDNVAVPAVWRFGANNEWTESLVEQLPLLVRPVDSHGGDKLVRVDTAEELARCRAEQEGPVYLTRFVDYRLADGWFRKYRIVFIDRKPFPCHLAISQNAIAHYHTSDMERHAWKVEEEKTFLRHPESVLGEAGMQAVRAIGAKMDIDYAGLDFSILPDKRILVFEANPVMRFHYELIMGPLEHKNEFVKRISDEFEALLQRCSHPM